MAGPWPLGTGQAFVCVRARVVARSPQMLREQRAAGWVLQRAGQGRTGQSRAGGAKRAKIQKMLPDFELQGLSTWSLRRSADHRLFALGRYRSNNSTVVICKSGGNWYHRAVSGEAKYPVRTDTPQGGSGLPSGPNSTTTENRMGSPLTMQEGLCRTW
ncbi:hypothetical protein PFICI_11084 [Pestalotiopsis fici W106-1]|uniref:Uncharacterized protein n=1 Tax=Pestalotiopsis fici (strain W106-1 / CGMCC3.15140) TaxID=1229662 RepID=W3WTP0_PESFW|nr:uncharacterized protein PFICI_11084 [Pestalotiopsis fici W106-1]ETS77210.1 hypothetical protein PFICI_11084 [Pestalotiopsis fici W106-1]